MTETTTAMKLTKRTAEMLAAIMIEETWREERAARSRAQETRVEVWQVLVYVLMAILLLIGISGTPQPADETGDREVVEQKYP
jgi:hypothetical protein